MTVEKWQSALRHTWEIILDAKKAEGVLEGHVEELVITLDANNSDSSDSDSEEESDIYEDCDVFPLDY